MVYNKAKSSAFRLWVAVATIALSFIGPLAVPYFQGIASAAQLSSRSVAISTAVSGATGVTYTFNFALGTITEDVEGLKFVACTTPLGACTAPAGINIEDATYGSDTGWDDTTDFAVDATGANDCVPAGGDDNILCANRTASVIENDTSVRTLVFNAIVNQNNTNCTGNLNCTFFIRITTYSDDDYQSADIEDTGTVASSTSQTITIAARVAEVLNFCLGTTAVDDATSVVAAGCSALTGTTVDLGVLDSGSVTVSPVDASPNGGNDLNGAAMLRTNAGSGAVVMYRAIQQSGTNHQGTLRVAGATCNVGTVNTDQCINAQGTTQGTFTAGTERFGMTIAGVNCGSVSSYTCVFATPEYNLVPDAEYLGGTNNATFGTQAGFAWDESGSTDVIASSTGPVDNEALILKFAATPNITTPTGSYTAQGDFIVVPTY